GRGLRRALRARARGHRAAAHARGSGRLHARPAGGGHDQGRVTRHWRWVIGGPLFASTLLNYHDPQTLTVPAPGLKVEFHWSNQDFALVVIAFRIAYAIMQTLAGRFIDSLGTRNGLSLAVLWYSGAAMLTSLANGLGSFCAFRFLLGMGEAANWP